MVKKSVEGTLNSLLDAEDACEASRCERSPKWVDTRAGYYAS
ncbi:hypothetical protein [Aminobacterium colombiense]